MCTHPHLTALRYTTLPRHHPHRLHHHRGQQAEPIGDQHHTRHDRHQLHPPAGTCRRPRHQGGAYRNHRGELRISEFSQISIPPGPCRSGILLHFFCDGACANFKGTDTPVQRGLQSCI